MEDQRASDARRIFSVVIFPFLTNISLLIFICATINITLPLYDLRNVLGLTSLAVLYLGGLAQFIAYGRSSGSWADLFGESANFLIVICLLLSYPFFYLYWLPFLIYRIIVYLGSPAKVWETIFRGSCMSLELFEPDSSGCVEVAFGFLYIGLPFVIFSVAYVGIVIIFSPLLYLVLSPIGLGNLGIILHISMQWPSTTELDFNDRVEKTSPMGSFLHFSIIALPSIVVSVLYIVYISPSWFAILLLVAAAVHSLGDGYFSTKGVLCPAEQ